MSREMGAGWLLDFELRWVKPFEAGVVLFYFFHLCLEVSIGDDGLGADDFSF